MTRSALRTLAFLAGLSLPFAPLFAENPPAAPAKAVAAPAKTPADPSVPAIKDANNPKSNFIPRHEGFVKIAKAGGVDLLFEGDSITDGWRGGGKEVWAKYYEPLHAANFGIGGDQTQHVLWRIENGELEGIKPKVVVLMIGTNNLGNPSDEAIAGGITTIVKTLHERLPETKVLLLAVFPRSPKAEDKSRARIKHINEIIAKLDDGKTTRYLDIGDKFLESDGTLPKSIMPDALHPNAKGYQIWADAMQPLLDEMMK